MGRNLLAIKPIPIPAFPLKGKEITVLRVITWPIPAVPLKGTVRVALRAAAAT